VAETGTPNGPVQLSEFALIGQSTEALSIPTVIGMSQPVVNAAGLNRVRSPRPV